MRKAVLFTMGAALMLPGCGRSTPNDPGPQASQASDEPTPTPAFSAAPTLSPLPSPAYTPPPAPPPAVPPPPPPLTAGAEKGDKGARAVLLTWARALENRQFGLAWEQFGHPPASRDGFARWWQRYRTITVALGDGSSEGAAGSMFNTVAATVTGTTVEGRPYRLQGEVVLRRVNDVDGASAAQLRWHIDSADLKAVPAT